TATMAVERDSQSPDTACRVLNPHAKIRTVPRSIGGQKDIETTNGTNHTNEGRESERLEFVSWV
ncbi:MAG TPA: hypothetical protein VLH56_01795, partial [Dissulfurispiraceae bacterium]|nr:hypothetical protein [Dissulfurispiraceae bacterium]